MNEASRTGVVVLVDPERFHEAVRAARAVGLAVTAEQSLLGTVTGTISEDRIPVLEMIDGVRAVDRERIVRLPPPDSPTQ